MYITDKLQFLVLKKGKKTAKHCSKPSVASFSSCSCSSSFLTTTFRIPLHLNPSQHPSPTRLSVATSHSGYPFAGFFKQATATAIAQRDFFQQLLPSQSHDAFYVCLRPIISLKHKPHCCRLHHKKIRLLQSIFLVSHFAAARSAPLQWLSLSTT